MKYMIGIAIAPAPRRKRRGRRAAVGVALHEQRPQAYSTGPKQPEADWLSSSFAIVIMVSYTGGLS